MGLSRIAQGAAEENCQNPAVASDSVVARVAKRARLAKERDLHGAAAAEAARAKRERKVVQCSTQPRPDLDAGLAPRRSAGVMLARLSDEDARSKAQRLRFQLVSDPLAFVRKVIQLPAAASKGQVVIAPSVDTDFSISGMVAVALLGGFLCTPKSFLDSKPRGVTYAENYKSSKASFHVAVSASLGHDMPTLPQLLKAVAQAPGSCVRFYMSERELHKFFKKAEKKSPLIKRRTCVLAKKGDEVHVKKKYKQLYINPRSFLMRFDASAHVSCPGLAR